MFRTIDDFQNAYENLTRGTRRVFGALTDENLEQTVAPGFRTVGRIAWHIVVSVPEMMNRTGLGLSSVEETDMPPASAAAIVDAYAAVSDELSNAVKSHWTDESLLESDDMYGERWPRGVTLLALVTHEAHHRGQLTVLLRQAGAVVPGVYGPAKQEWVDYGMEAPAY